MSIFDSLGSVFNPSSWMGDSGNSFLDLMDPGNTFHTGSSTRAANKQFQLESDIAERNYELSKEQNAWNRNFQEQQLQYQKELNALQMEREDTATARRVADLKAAGLSPTLAAGSAADTGSMHAGSVTPVQPARMDTPGNSKVQAAMFKESLMKDRMQLAASLMGNIANVSKTRAEVQLLNAQANQLNTLTPVEYKLKSQLLEFNEDFNPWKIADTISSVENRKADTYYKERQRFLVDSQTVLNNDEHGLNIQRAVGLALDNQLKSVRISLDNQNYIKNAISIELLRQEYRMKEAEYSEYQYSRDFYNKKWGVPVGFNLSPWTSYFGYKEHEPGNPYGTPDPVSDRFNPFDKTPGSWNNFVERQIEKATNFLKQTGIYKGLMRVFGGAFDFSH